MATGGDEVSEVRDRCPICCSCCNWRQETIPDIADEAMSPTVEAVEVWNLGRQEYISNISDEAMSPTVEAVEVWNLGRQEYISDISDEAMSPTVEAVEVWNLGRQEYISDISDEAMSPTVEAWNRDLRKNLEITSKPPNVKKSTFEDARKLFGANFETKVTLRTAEQVTAKEEISLIQFDPNLLSKDVVCRYASCNIKNPEAAKSGKRDLFLCPQHQQALQDSISEVFRRVNIRDIASTSAERQEANCFSGYTSLISLLEAAYRDATNLPTSTNESKLKQEAILNVRNFLIITSTLLNPDESNLKFLPYVVDILNKTLTSDSAEVFVYVLRETVLIILSAFGVIFSWVSFALQSPFAKIGAGAMGFVGGIAGLATGGPLIGAAGLGAGVVLWRPHRRWHSRPV